MTSLQVALIFLAGAGIGCPIGFILAGMFFSSARDPFDVEDDDSPWGQVIANSHASQSARKGR